MKELVRGTGQSPSRGTTVPGSGTDLARSVPGRPETTGSRQCSGVSDRRRTPSTVVSRAGGAAARSPRPCTAQSLGRALTPGLTRAPVRVSSGSPWAGPAVAAQTCRVMEAERRTPDKVRATSPTTTAGQIHPRWPSCGDRRMSSRLRRRHRPAGVGGGWSDRVHPGLSSACDRRRFVCSVPCTMADRRAGTRRVSPPFPVDPPPALARDGSAPRGAGVPESHGSSRRGGASCP